MAQRKMLLIVDDDPDVREGLAEQLAQEFSVAQAATGADGVAQARARGVRLKALM